MHKRITIISLIFIKLLFSQFNEIEISYDYNDMIIKNNHEYILEDFNQKIINYFKYNKFTYDHDYLEINLKFHVVFHNLNFVEQNNYNGINCQFFISNQNGQYYITKTLHLPYFKGKDFYYNHSSFDEISSLIDFYAYAFIADELDTYGLFLGDNYYNLALELTKMSRRSENYEQWEKNKDLIKTITENKFLRTAKFEYYSAIDILSQEKYNKNNLIIVMKNLLTNLKAVNKKYGYEKNTLKFLETFNQDISEILNILEMKKEIEFLANFDYKNKYIYEEYLNEK